LTDIRAPKGRANSAKTQEIAGIFASAMENLQKLDNDSRWAWNSLMSQE
jgi:hypothetical protein